MNPAPPPPAAVAQAEIAQLEPQVAANVGNFPAASRLVGLYLQTQQNPKAAELLTKMLDNPKADEMTVRFVAEMFANRLGDIGKVETALVKLLKLTPDSPEGWFDLAAVQTVLNKPGEAVKSLDECLQRNAKRLAAAPASPNLYSNLQTDARFAALRPSPDFQKLVQQYAGK